MTGLYIHIPFCASKCAYCDFVSFPNREGDFSAYIDAIIREIELRKPLPIFDTVFFGGGTPSILPPEAIPRVLDHVSKHIRPGAEITCEANPGSLTAAHINAWKRAGVNRLSLGAQSADAELLRILGRAHIWQDVIEAANIWGEPNHLSIDLMYGLPNQTPEQWEQTLSEAIRLNPGHLSLYSLILEEGTPLHSRVLSGRLSLPDPDAYDPQTAALELLTPLGYKQYEISNYARNGHFCLHNINYWKRGEYIGLGCAAHSYMDGIRSANVESLETYLSMLSQNTLPISQQSKLSEKEALFEELMLGLRMTEGVSLSPQAYHLYKNSIDKMISIGMMEIVPPHIRLTARGMDVMNLVLEEFLI